MVKPTYHDILYRLRLQVNPYLRYERAPLWWFFDYELYLCAKQLFRDERGIDRSVYSKDVPRAALRLVNGLIAARSALRKLLYRLAVLGRKPLPSARRGPKILAVSHSNYWKQYPKSRLSRATDQDSMIGPILSALGERGFDVLALDDDASSLLDLGTLVSKSRSAAVNWKPVEAYLSGTMLRKAGQQLRSLGDCYGRINWDSLGVDASDEAGHRVLRQLRKRVDILFHYGFFLPLLYLEMVGAAIAAEKPDLILVSCAYCSLGRAAVIAGKLRGIPTVEVQHGNINPSHRAYLFAERGEADVPEISRFIVPDAIAVHGSYYRELLENEPGYGPGRLLVTGQPRYDVLHQIDRSYSAREIRGRLGIPEGRKVVLWTTQCHGFGDPENKATFDAVFSAAAGENFTLVIKPHPLDGKKYGRMMEPYLRRYGVSPVIVPNNCDTYELMYASDAVITKSSTTGAEAIALNRPLIVLNLSGEPDQVEYVQEKVASGVYRKEDLQPALRRALHDPPGSGAAREEFIRKYLHRIDGKATERVVEAVTRLTSAAGERR